MSSTLVAETIEQNTKGFVLPLKEKSKIEPRKESFKKSLSPVWYRH